MTFLFILRMCESVFVLVFRGIPFYLCAGFLFSAFPPLKSLKCHLGKSLREHARGWFKWKMALWEFPDHIKSLYGCIWWDNELGYSSKKVFIDGKKE